MENVFNKELRLARLARKSGPDLQFLTQCWTLSLCSMLTVCASAQEVTRADTTASFVAGDLHKTRYTLGGYIKLDAMISHYSDGEMGAKIGRDFFLPVTIPTGGEGSITQVDFSAKTSRLFFKSQTTTERGDVNTHIEMDFIESLQGDERFANSYSSRLRHAYVKWNYGEGKFVSAGQTWSNFFNVSALPELVDFVGPAGTIFAIQPQLALGCGKWVVAAENPTSTLHVGEQLVNTESNRFPDFTLRYNLNTESASYGVGVLVRELAAVESNNKVYAPAYALSGSAKIKINHNNDVRLMVNYGNGLGRYMGFNSFRDAYVDEDKEVETITQVGGFIALRHLWNSDWRSTLALSASHADNPEALSFNPAQSYRSLHVNLLYSPMRNMDLGAELIYGKKVLENDQSGSLSRLQFGVKYSF